VDNRLKKRLKHTVTHLPFLEEDSYGDKIMGPPIQHNCYIYGKISHIRNLDGEDDVSTVQLIFGDVLSIGPKDEIIFRGKKYPVKAYSHYDGLKEGTGTTVVYL